MATNSTGTPVEAAPSSPAADAAPEPIADTTLAPDAIRNSPEYQAIAEQNRILARQAGDAKAQAAKVREEAERQRQAAEAQRAAAMETQLKEVLGPDGVAAWAEIAELSRTDQVAAAKRFRDLMQGAQSAAPAPAAQASAPATTEETVSQTTQAATPPPPTSGLDGGQPLGQSGPSEDLDVEIDRLSTRYNDVVERNQNPATRNRVTMRDRGDAMISFLGAAYLKALRNRQP